VRSGSLVETDELANIIGRDIYKVRDENKRMLQEVRESHEHYKKSLPIVIIKANNIKTSNIAPMPLNNSFCLFL
jgi:small nuclear ribonucleoprotein (snRNP)-like protein